ncbi:MAG: phosphonate C-P lyase system protein PhnL [Zoogloeaceae bacterium]|jgi:alpha-D-ribose 1-methylphosphonate 5-triphosphate synthase subunit PhnL|nr:phosphonate C-P lyase system protein PhnL [Zoogloeaceae bacterium]
MDAILKVSGLAKTFVLRQPRDTVIEVLRDISFAVFPGECLVLSGPSGTGKSTLLRILYGNYLASGGSIRLRQETGWIELAGADPRCVLAARRHTLGYVSQFLRVIPRVTALDVIMEPALLRGYAKEVAQAKAEALLVRLDIPEKLWSLAPGTFSGGEQQRINIARSFMVFWPVLLLDEPTASLDGKNRQIVLELIEEAKAAGSAIVGIFHDAHARDAVASRLLYMKDEKERAHVT